MSAANESAEADTDNDSEVREVDDSQSESATETADEGGREDFPWVYQGPGTRIAGTPVQLIYGGNLGENAEQNDTSFGVVYEDPSVVIGDLMLNDAKPEDGTTADAVEDDEPRPTDYRLVDVEDDDVKFDRDGNVKTNENGPNIYDDAESFEEDRVLVWYNGMAGQRLARTLDFNGRPFASFSDGDEPYLVKGLLQVAEGWRDASSSEKGDMVRNGKAPRIARAPILRNEVELQFADGDVVGADYLDEPTDLHILVDLRRAESGRGYRINAFDAGGFEDEFESVNTPISEIESNDYGQLEADSELGMLYTNAADDVLDAAEYRMSMYTGDGWQSEPEGWESDSQAGTSSFGIGSDDEQAEESTDAEIQQFADEVAGELSGTGMTIEEAFDDGLTGLIEEYAEGRVSTEDAEEIREAVYASPDVSHLSTDDLDE